MIALLVVATVVMVATGVSKDFMVLLRQVENQLHSQQAYAYLQGAEGIGRRILQDDLRDDRSNGRVDHRDEGWLEVEQQFVTDHGALVGVMADLQGRFNLNNLQNEKPPKNGGSTAAYSEHAQRFIRLLQLLELDQPIDQTTAEAITASVVDWLDSDDRPRPQGAEDYYYGDAEPASRTANRPLASVSELRMVKDVSAELYDALRPFVTVWPARGGDININTASETVLRSINKDKVLQPMDEADAAVIVEERDRSAGLANLELFSQPPFDQKQLAIGGLGVGSNYFLLDAQTQFMDRSYEMHSVLYRDDNSGEVTVVARSVGTL